MGQFLLQMAGWMGSGKSTIASAVGVATRAVVLDHDTSKTAVLAAGVSHPPAGAASYEVLFAITADLLRQGHSVIIDSPAAYRSVPERGLALAEGARVPYYFAECECPEDIATARVASRDTRPSQVSDAFQAAAVRADGSGRPSAQRKPDVSPVAFAPATRLGLSHPVQVADLVLH